MAQLSVLGPFQKFFNGQTVFELQGNNVEALVNTLMEMYPDIRPKVFNDGNLLNSYVNVFVDEKDIRYIHGLGTEVKPNSKVVMFIATAGG